MSRTPRELSREEDDRTTRIPLGVNRAKLTINNRDPDYVYRWINEETHSDPDRLNSALAAGYEFVHRDGVRVGEGLDGNADLGSRVSRIVGKKSDGTKLSAYAMRIKKEWHLSDQRAKEQERKRTMDVIKRGDLDNKAHEDNRYVKTSDFTTS